MSLRDEWIAALETENDMLRERLRRLEGLLGMALPAPLEWGLTAREAAVFGLLYSRGFATTDAVMAALYRDLGRDEADVPIIKVFVCKLRKKVRPFGLEIETVWGVGYRMTEASRAAVRARWPELDGAAQPERPAA